MNAIAQWLKEKGKIVIPKTLDTQVFDENGKSLDRRLKTAKDEQIIQLPKVNPTLIISDLNYSTEEQLTGKRWINGKPIYQKTYVINAPVRGSWTVFDERTTFDNLIDDSFRIIDNNGTSEQIYRGMTSDGNSTRVSVSKNGSAGKGLSYYIGTGIWSNQAVTTLTAVIIVQYTKTTDTASSPVAPPKVEAMHAYSTDEKVVGTWVDGKPLYEKTVYFGSGTLSNRASVSFENMNIDKIMVISGTFEDTTEGQLSIPVSLDGTFYVGFYCNRRSILLTFSSTFNGRISNAYAIIQYTKTTDTATA